MSPKHHLKVISTLSLIVFSCSGYAANNLDDSCALRLSASPDKQNAIHIGEPDDLEMLIFNEAPAIDGTISIPVNAPISYVLTLPRKGEFNVSFQTVECGHLIGIEELTT